MYSNSHTFGVSSSGFEALYFSMHLSAQSDERRQ